MDPRPGIIEARLAKVRNVLVVSGAKGGVGKTSVASVLALTLSRSDYRVGLLDLDFTCPSAHVILGAEGLYPQEANGIVPPDLAGVKFMSIHYFTGRRPAALRGSDVTNVMIELLAITRWEALDFLILDMPPGLGDVTLDVIRLMPNVRFLIVTTASRLALETVKNMLTMLRQMSVPVLGVVENMRRTSSSVVRDELHPFNVPVIGEIDFDGSLEEAIGNTDQLLHTRFATDVKEMILRAQHQHLL